MTTNRLLCAARSMAAGVYLLAAIVIGTNVLACSKPPAANPTAQPNIIKTETLAPKPTFTSIPVSTPTTAATATPAASPTPGLPPEITGSNPIDGDLTMTAERPIILQFDQPMDQDALAANLKIEPDVDVMVEWPEPDRAAITAAGGWVEDAYQVSVLPGMRSLSGVEMGEPFTFSFETGGYGVPVPILMYHNIKDFEDESEASELQLAWTVKETAFKEQMKYLRDNGWHSISVQELVGYFSGATLPPKPVVISMDDAWISLQTRAWPVFQETGLRPVVYVVAEFPTYGEDYLNWDQLRELVAEGMIVGCHSYTHASLYELSAEDLRHEVYDARDEIEAQLGVELDTFSYPFGAYGDATVAEVEAAGFTSAVTLNPVGYQDPTDPFRLNRLQVDYHMTMDQFIETVTGRLGYYLYYKYSR